MGELKMKTRMLIGAGLAVLLGLAPVYAQVSPPQSPKGAAGQAQPAKASTVKVKWSEAAPLPVGVFDAAGTLMGNRRYVVTGGLWQAGLANDGVQVFEVKGNQWSSPCKLKTARFNHTQVALDDERLLVVGGQATKQVIKGIPIFSAELIDLKTGTCEALPDAPDAKPLRAPLACLMGDVAVIVGGDRAYRFNRVTQTWLPSIKLHQARAYCAITPLDDKRLLVVGGEGRDTMEVVDLSKSESALLDVRMPMMLDDLQALKLHDGRVWIVGGQDSKTGNTTEKTWFYAIDEAGAKLVDGPVLGVKKGVADHRLVTALPYVYVIGGESQLDGADTELNVVRALDVRTFAVRPVTSLPEPCDDSLAFEYAGRVYVVGGYHLGPVTMGGIRLPRASADVHWCQAGDE